MKGKITLTVLLSLVVLALAFFNVKAIVRPAKYSSVYQDRRETNLNRLTLIKELQQLYTEKNGHCATNIDELINFYNTGFLETKSTHLVLPAGLTEEERQNIENMSMKEKDSLGYLVAEVKKVPVKGLMEGKVAEINKNRTDYLASMKDFYKVPYTETKYTIVIAHDTSCYQVTVPVDLMMSNFDTSLDNGFMNALFYRNMGDMGKNNIKDRRDVRHFIGYQLGDTTSRSLEIKDYGTAAE